MPKGGDDIDLVYKLMVVLPVKDCDVRGGNTDVTIVEDKHNYGCVNQIDIVITFGGLRLGGDDVNILYWEHLYPETTQASVICMHLM